MNKSFNLSISKRQTNILKGSFAVCVLLHHLYQYTEFLKGTIVSPIFEALGYLSVAVFLFLSGYGLMASKLAKGDGYLKGFVKSKVLVLYLQTLSLVLLYILTFVILGQHIKTNTLILSFIFGKTVIVNGWYLYCAIFMYLIFWSSFRFFKKSIGQVLCFVGGLGLYYAICLAMNLSHLWYQCVLAFALGILYAVLVTRVKSISMTKAILIFAASVVVFLGSIGLSLKSEAYPFIHITSKMISAASFPIMVVFSKEITTVVLKLLGYLQSISLEIYVCQGLFLIIFAEIVSPVELPLVYILCVVVATILFSFALHWYFMKIALLLKNK